MTLILGMSKPEGIYMSADFRVTESGSGRVIDDASVKLLNVLFPPPDRGTRALLAYAGLAILPGSTTPLGTWLIETMRGQSEYPDQAMAHLRHRLDRDVAPHRIGFMLNALLIEGENGERRLFGGFTNMRHNTATRRFDVLPAFEYMMKVIDGPFMFANGSGVSRAIAGAHLETAHTQLKIRPRRARDHMKLLASINRRVAAKEKTVSPACHVAFVPAKRPMPGVSDNRFGPTSGTFADRGEPAPAVMPTLFCGLDLTPMELQMKEQMAATAAGTDQPPVMDIDTLNRLLRRRD
jgi:hypothetical protein